MLISNIVPFGMFKDKYSILLSLAKPYLEKNDFGVAHTKRVLDIALNHFQIPRELEELVHVSIILHDIGGCSIKDQYEKGPKIATKLLKQLSYNHQIILEVCEIIRTHHERTAAPTEPFKILYDADQLAKFSEEEFPSYNSENIDWNSIIDSMYQKHAKMLARKMFNAKN